MSVVVNDGVPLTSSATNADIVSVLNQLILQASNTSDSDALIGAYEAYNSPNDVASTGGILWVLIAGFLVFFMHAGFSMLETGCITAKNAINILFKNVGTVAIGGVCYYLLGYGFAFGDNNAGNSSSRFIGSGDFALYQTADPTNDAYPETGRHFWFFQFAFAATSATIVSGAMAGRMNLSGYFITAALMTSFVYPVVSHWVWSAQGWISAFTEEPFLSDKGGCGMIDYAGSGVVHMTGGVAAFIGTAIIGPRLGRFDADGNDTGNLPAHNLILCTLGTFILWFGWYGFNCGSTLAFDGSNAAKVAVTTTLSPSMAAVTAIVLSRVLYGHFDLSLVLNSVLGGLVGITAGCATVDDWAALVIGFVACFVYLGASTLVKKLGMDDVVDAFAVHGACGMWGVLAAGIFSTPHLISSAYGKSCDGWTSGQQFGTQFVGIFAIIGWVTLMMVPFFLVLKVAGILRVSADEEEAGLDHSEHGGKEAFDGAHKSDHGSSKAIQAAEVAQNSVGEV